MHLDDGHEAWFVDPRTFGEVVVFDPDNVEVELPELARMGVDPIAEPFDPAMLRAAFGGSRRALKPLLLDQHVVAGIGNIYADEILHRARLRPDRAASTLDRRRLRVLHASIVGVLSEAIAAGGLHARRFAVRRPDGRGRLVPGRSPCVRPRWRALLDVRTRLDPPNGDRRPRHPLLPGLPVLIEDSGSTKAERVVSLLLCS